MAAREKRGAVYEITLRGAPPRALIARVPVITVVTEPPATVLFKQISDPAEVDELTERLRTLGITPLEVRASVGHYELRIEGRLGRPILGYLQWDSRLEPERAVVRVMATQKQLRMILEQLAQEGTEIERCVRCSAA
jgi:hypothetical protein